MTKMQEILGRILRNRINSELKKEVKEFTTIQETMDIFLAGDKIIAEQYTEFTELITPAITTDSAINKTTETNA